MGVMSRIAPAARLAVERLALAPGDAVTEVAVPAQMRWLANLTDDELAAHITASYGYIAPAAFSSAEAIEELFAMVRRFEG